MNKIIITSLLFSNVIFISNSLTLKKELDMTLSYEEDAENQTVYLRHENDELRNKIRKLEEEKR